MSITRSTTVFCIFLYTLFNFVISIRPVDLNNNHECFAKSYEHVAVQRDETGRKCWDTFIVKSCFGKCDSNEVSNWKFPYKISHHPVCIHGDYVLREVVLSNCEEGVAEGTDKYTVVDAVTCRCLTCHSSKAKCEGLVYLGQRSLNNFVRG